MSMAASQHPSDSPDSIVLMGVSGCGKTTVGTALASRLAAIYIDGDDLHPPSNIAKMSSGEALSDSDRWPWLAEVGRRFLTVAGPAIIGCSALKRSYRDHIVAEAGGSVTFVHLVGSRDLVLSRLSGRSNHFMPAALLDSQFAALEAPDADERAITIDIGRPLEMIVADILIKLRELKP